MPVEVYDIEVAVPQDPEVRDKWDMRSKSLISAQDEARQDIRELSTWDIMGMAALSRIRDARDALTGYAADIVGNPGMRARMEADRAARKHREQFYEQAMAEERPIASMAGEAIAEMGVPAPYAGARYLPMLAAGAAQSVFLDMLDPDKTKEDMVTGAGTTVGTQIALDALTRGLMPGTRISKRVPQEEADRMRKLMDEGYILTPAQRSGVPADTRFEREIATSGGGLRGFDPMVEHNRAVANRAAMQAIGSTAANPSRKEMSKALQRIQGQYNKLFSGRSLEPDMLLEDQLYNIASGIDPKATGPLRRSLPMSPDVKDTAASLWEKVVDHDQFLGDDLQDTLKALRKSRDGARKSDPRKAAQFQQLEDTLLEWAERASPDDQFRKGLAETNRQYAAWKTLAKPKVVQRGNVDVQRAATQVRRQGSDVYARDKGFGNLDLLVDMDDYTLNLPRAVNFAKKGQTSSIISHKFPWTSPAYYTNRLRSGVFPNLPAEAPVQAGNIAGYLAARENLNSLMGQAAATGIAGIGAGSQYLWGLLEDKTPETEVIIGQ